MPDFGYQGVYQQPSFDQQPAAAPTQQEEQAYIQNEFGELIPITMEEALALSGQIVSIENQGGLDLSGYEGTADAAATASYGFDAVGYG